MIFNAQYIDLCHPLNILEVSIVPLGNDVLRLLIFLLTLLLIQHLDLSGQIFQLGNETSRLHQCSEMIRNALEVSIDCLLNHFLFKVGLDHVVNQIKIILFLLFAEMTPVLALLIKLHVVVHFAGAQNLLYSDIGSHMRIFCYFLWHHAINEQL